MKQNFENTMYNTEPNLPMKASAIDIAHIAKARALFPCI